MKHPTYVNPDEVNGGTVGGDTGAGVTMLLRQMDTCLFGDVY